MSAYFLDTPGLGRLIEALHDHGYRVLGPTLRDHAIVYDDLPSAERLPMGWGDEQAPGRYRLHQRADRARFGYAVGPHAWRRFLQVPDEELYRVETIEEGFQLKLPAEPDKPLAFLGVRGCDLAAIQVQDRVFQSDPHADRRYQARRVGAVVIGVSCGSPAATCFCPSMGTGPTVGKGADLTLIEVPQGPEDDPWYLARSGTDFGSGLVTELDLAAASEAQVAQADGLIAAAEARIERTLNTTELPAILTESRTSRRWDQVASRCLACTNCTLVCPTCFCNATEDHTDVLTGEAVHSRRWDSCFTGDFSYIHGGAVRGSTASRYRHWLTHKLGTWAEQFGVSGCVGCGRCITWCPPGIDLTEEVQALRSESGHGD